jgi:hypothetical protein
MRKERLNNLEKKTVKTETTNRFSMKRIKALNQRLTIASSLKVRAKNHQQALDTKDSFRDGDKRNPVRHDYCTRCG